MRRAVTDSKSRVEFDPASLTCVPFVGLLLSRVDVCMADGCANLPGARLLSGSAAKWGLSIKTSPLQTGVVVIVRKPNLTLISAHRAARRRRTIKG